MPWRDSSLSDEERDALGRDMLEDRPDLDLANSWMGELAGPASLDRPDLPLWEYCSHVKGHPGIALGDLTLGRLTTIYESSDWEYAA